MRGELFYSCVIGFASGVLLRSFFIFSVDAVGTLIAIGIVAFLLIHRWMPVLKIYGISFLIFSLAFACGALRAGYTLDGLHENRLSEFELRRAPGRCRCPPAGGRRTAGSRNLVSASAPETARSWSD